MSEESVSKDSGSAQINLTSAPNIDVGELDPSPVRSPEKVSEVVTKDADNRN